MLIRLLLRAPMLIAAVMIGATFAGPPAADAALAPACAQLAASNAAS